MRPSPWLVLALLATAGTPSPAHPPASDGQAAPSPAPASASPSAPAPRDPSSRWPPPAPPVSGQRGECPLDVVPGRSLGPLTLGQRVADLGASGLPVRQVSISGPTAFYVVGPYHVRACAGAVCEVWIDDLRQAPDCVRVAGAPVDRAQARDAFIARFQGCHELPPREGGTFTECEKGGVHIGYGLGTFVQVRVGLVGSDLDDECEDLLSDGREVPLPPAALRDLLQQTLDLPRLAPYWHPSLPGRSPLRVVPPSADPAYSNLALFMFGSKVEWVDRSVPADGRPRFEITRLSSTDRRATLEFSYPPEGVIGRAVFQRRSGEWRLVSATVSER